MQQNRMARLANELQQEIATIIHQELKDPTVGFVTITRIELSKDVRHAKVLFSCLGGEADRARSQDALDRSARYIQGLLKKRFRLKIIPALVFQFDETVAQSIAMAETLDRLNALPPSRERQAPGHQPE